MEVSQATVESIVEDAVSGKLNIPAFQRNFVWNPEQVKRLAESLYWNYPVGSFLWWDSSKYPQAKTTQSPETQFWILDGQQRTVALCLIFGRKPYWWEDTESWNEALERYDVMVNILPDEDDDRLEFALPNPVRRRDPRWISLRRVLTEGIGSLAREIINKGKFDEKLTKKVEDRLEELKKIRGRIIPVVRIRHEVDDAIEIFVRLNQEGTRVKEADAILAIIAGLNEDWVRNEFLPFRDRLEDDGWDLDVGILLRTMTGIGGASAQLKDVTRSFWTPENLPKLWRETQEIIVEVLYLRLPNYGITSEDLLPSANSLIPLFVLHHRWKSDQSNYRFGRALLWFLRANWDGRYSGAAITSLNEDIRTIREAKSFDEAIEKLESRLEVPPEMDKHEFLKPKGRFSQLMLYLLLFRREARDWLDGTRIGFGRAGEILSGFRPQWHHIYPRNVLKKGLKEVLKKKWGRDVSENEINSLINSTANLTILNRKPNIKLGGRLPSDYIKDISEEDLRAHLIPEDFIKAKNEGRLKEQWSLERYEEFLDKRAQLLAEEANKFFQELENAP